MPEEKHVKTRFAYSGKSDVGQKRTSNQDQFLIADIGLAVRIASNSIGIDQSSQLEASSRGCLLVVADGMGGHHGGNRASEIAIHQVAARLASIHLWVSALDQDDTHTIETGLRSVVLEAHKAIVAEASQREEFKEMGTTLTIALGVGDRLWIAHVGDSRCYLIRGDELRRLTQDHTVANQIATRGGMSVEYLEQSPWSNVLWNALGASANELQVDVVKESIRVGDRILLCSDGLNKHLRDVDIHRLSIDAIDPRAACEKLVNRANEAGGSDNITVVICDVMSADDEETVSKSRLNQVDAVFLKYSDAEEMGSTTDLDPAMQSNLADTDTFDKLPGSETENGS